ncbi:hypothetical protein [Microcystis sp. M42BS1]|uniref:hypothetical protein n=1 Tax=Microcystis sp. M42BS1 TaxID=2771192 RepID=UPI002584139A|nr:hypothetical protein [Microcystis sp. M42BS1]MCA2570665.1 hypothetical protein [Microcystis sp. M42BS1]
MNKYTQAVDYISQYVEATHAIQLELPEVESALEVALKILKSNEHYDGHNLPQPQTS